MTFVGCKDCAKVLPKLYMVRGRCEECLDEYVDRLEASHAELVRMCNVAIQRLREGEYLDVADDIETALAKEKGVGA